MHFAEQPGLTALRAEVREVVDGYVTDDVRRRMRETGTMHDRALYREMARRGWVGSRWPGSEGGGLDLVEYAVLVEELSRADAPIDGWLISDVVGETLLRAGESTIQDEVVDGVRRGETLLSLGFSEPGAGTDVASVTTRAVPDGDSWVINGQKVFTTLAHEADYVFLLARTSPEKPKHQGLTMFLVPTDAEGFSLDPIHTLGGERTNVTYYRDVRIPDSHRVSPVDEGWKVLLIGLTGERGNLNVGQIDRLVEAARSWSSTEAAGGPDTGRAERLGRLLAEAEVARLLGRATVSNVPGADTAVAAAVSKYYGAEALVRGADTVLGLAGPAGLLEEGAEGAALDGVLEHLYRHAHITTIYGGCSEVMLDIVAQQHLGLPRIR